MFIVLVETLTIILFVVVLATFFGGWFSNRSQVKDCFSDYKIYGFASFKKFKEYFDQTNWTHQKGYKWSLFYEEKPNQLGYTSKIHASIFMFNHIGMIMKTPIDYWKAIAYVHKYIKIHFPEDLNKKNIKLYKWE